jgi:hypothetical protein
MIDLLAGVLRGIPHLIRGVVDLFASPLRGPSWWWLQARLECGALSTTMETVR